jgi:hypothetical protein
MHPTAFFSNYQQSPNELDAIVNKHLAFRQDNTRRHSSAHESQYYCRRLCRDTTVIVEMVARHITRGLTEHEIAAEMTYLCYEMSIAPIALYVTADSYEDDLYYPRNYPVSHYVSLLLIGYRDGWYTPVTRTVALDTLPTELERRYDAVAWASEFYLHQTRIGQPMPRLTNMPQTFPEDWSHPPDCHIFLRSFMSGGPTGQAINENQPVEPDQIVTCLAGLGSIRAANTFIVRPDGSEPLTRTNGWPVRSLSVDSATYFLPDILRL